MKIVFLCVANSARSQMAEALARKILDEKLGPGIAEVSSAGSKPSSVNPFALEALKEIGIDHKQARSKSIEEIDFASANYVVTLCADEVCPVFAGAAKKQHWPFSDPAAATGSSAEVLEAFRNIRDAIAKKIATFNWNET